ncbi:hypothetical protein GCM10022232_27380 [Streptomyces plumbiresistens]|uniref:Uncharacterized protein n=1 Tax=Streptomyces plumbiresistens TaxID=511811 RepID=A0ABP7R1S7_9ACTN
MWGFRGASAEGCLAGFPRASDTASGPVSEAGRAAGMRVVGVGARAGFHGPDALVRDLTEVRVEGVGDGGIRLYVG